MGATKGIIGKGTTLGYGAPANEVQTVTIGGTPTGGTFLLGFNGVNTSPLAYNVSASAMQTALEALANIGSGNVTVAEAGSGSIYTVTFAGSLAGTSQFLLTANGSALTGGSSPNVTVEESTAGGGQGDTFTTLAEVKNVTPPPVQLEEYEATHYTSPDGFKEWLAGWSDGGEVDFDINYIYATTNTVNSQRGVPQTFQITLPDTHTWTFNGFIKGISGTIPNKGVCELKVKIKVTGMPTFD